MAYKCPDCGGRMETSQFPTYPPQHEATCTSCGVHYREQPIKPPLEPLPVNFRRFSLDGDSATKNFAMSLCFKDCSAGRHLDFEAGCVTKCSNVGQCQGWKMYIDVARHTLREGKTDD